MIAKIVDVIQKLKLLEFGHENRNLSMTIYTPVLTGMYYAVHRGSICVLRKPKNVIFLYGCE